MKLRLRLNKVARVIDIDEERSEIFTVDDLCEKVKDVFRDVIAGEFFLSLNNKDALEGCKKLVSECDIVSGDLIYVVKNGNWINETQATKHSGVSGAASSSSKISNTPSPSNSKSSADTNKTNIEAMPGGSSKQHNICSEQSDCKREADRNELESNMTVEHNDNTGECSMETDHVDLVIVKQCLSEPTLCRESSDGCLPALLRELYSNTNPRTVPESLSIVLHVLMLETGFNVYPESDTGLLSKMPDNFQGKGSFKFTYTYPGCQDTNCTVIVVPTGSSVMAHGMVSGVECSTRKCFLKSNEFVQKVTEDCTECYCQLAKLSRIFKDAICIPLVNDIRQASGLPDLIGLLALTQEIKLKILSFLDVRSLLQMSCVNHEFQEVCGDPYLWRRLYLKEFGNRSDMSLSQDWKRFFRHEFKIRKERRKAMSRMKAVTPPFWGPHNPFGGASNWIPPPMPGGIIGGDYDLFSNFPSGYPGIPGRMGPQPPVLPRPRYDLIGPTPDVDPGPDPNLIPNRPGFSGRGSGGRGGGSLGFGGFGPKFF